MINFVFLYVLFFLSNFSFYDFLFQFKQLKLFKKLRKMKAQNKSHAIIIVSENLLDINELAKKIQDNTGFEARTEVLGRLQRGGSPSAHDRIIAARMGHKAVELICNGNANKTVGIRHNEVISTPISEAINQKHEHTHGLRDLIDMLQ